MFSSVFVKGDFLFVVSHLYDVYIQVFYLKTAVPALVTEKRFPRNPDDPELPAEEIPHPKEIVYAIQDKEIEDDQEAVLKMARSLQNHPDEVVDMIEIQKNCNEMFLELQEKFKVPPKPKEKSTKKIKKQPNNAS